MPKKTMTGELADGRYLLINLVTRRARDLARGAKPSIPYAEGGFDPVEVAQEEWESNKLVVRRHNERTEEYEEFPGF